VPASGGGRHRFTEVLPRLAGRGETCLECATELEPWEGQPAPRLYGFSARAVAGALARVAAGSSVTMSRLARMMAACSAARRPARRRISTIDGRLAFSRASSVPKSVSADIRTRLSLRACARTTGSVAAWRP
jgi:hypothetical protein